MSEKCLSLKEILFANRKIHSEMGCWLWIGRCNSNGYGVLSIDGRDKLVHRLSFIEFKGELKNFALHIPTCFFKNCFNPEHLYDGHFRENIADMQIIGSHANQYGKIDKTHCKNGHKLFGENLIITSEGKRRCRTCQKEYNRNNPNRTNYNKTRANKRKLGLSS